MVMFSQKKQGIIKSIERYFIIHLIEFRQDSFVEEFPKDTWTRKQKHRKNMFTLKAYRHGYHHIEPQSDGVCKLAIISLCPLLYVTLRTRALIICSFNRTEKEAIFLCFFVIRRVLL